MAAFPHLLTYTTQEMLAEHLLGPGPENMCMGQESRGRDQSRGPGRQKRPEGGDKMAGRSGFWAEGRTATGKGPVLRIPQGLEHRLSVQV